MAATPGSTSSDDGSGGNPTSRMSRRDPWSSREIAHLGLMAALWGVIEITVGGFIKGWQVPFVGGVVLAAFGVVVLLVARVSVPRPGSTLAVGLVAAGIKAISAYGAAQFAALGIVIEALIVELALSLVRPGSQVSRYLAGALAVLWPLAHPFVLWGAIAHRNPLEFTVGRILGDGPLPAGQIVTVIVFLAIVHVSLGVSAVTFVDRILLAPLARARGILPPRTDTPDAESGSGRTARRGGGTRASVVAVLALLLAFSVSPLSHAQESSRNGGDGGSNGGTQGDSRRLSTYSFPEITVFGTRLLGPYAVVEVDESDMQRAGIENLAQALSMVPGMIVRTNARGEEKVGTRGLAEREMVVLVDGVPLSDPYTGAVNTNMILAGAMGTVSVTRGPAATVYGANALGGVVEVNTSGQDRSGLGYRLSAGSDGSYSGYLRGGGQLGNAHLSGGISTNGTSDFSLPAAFEPTTLEDGGLRDFSASEDMMVWGRAAGRITETVGASVSVQVSDGRRDAPVATDSERPRYWGFPNWRESRTVASVNWRPDGFAYLEAKLFYSTNDNQLASYNDPAREQRRWLSTVSNRAVGGYAFAEYKRVVGHRLSAGLNVRGDIARQQGDVGAEWERYDATTGSIFAQDIISLGADDRLSVAVNADAVSGSGRSLTSVNPQVAWSHSFEGGISTRLLAGVKTRFPTLKEWYSPQIGNPDLRPERATSFEAEFVKGTRDGSRLSVLLFDQRVKDMIATAGWGEPADNIGAVHAWGAELGVLHRLSPHLRIDLSLAMTSARDLDADTDVPLVPKTLATGVVTYETGATQHSVRITRVGPRANDEISSLPPYTLVGLRTTVETRWGSLFAGVENLFDVLYEDESGFPQPGRGFEVGIMRDLFH